MNGFALDPGDERASLVGLLDELLETGVHVAGDLSIGLADVPLIRVALRLLVASEGTAARTAVDAGDARDLPLDHTRAPIEAPAAGTDQARPSPRPSAPRARRDAVARPLGGAASPNRSEDDEQLADGVARLVLTVVAVIHDLVERQAVRRVEAGELDDEQVERLGLALEALEDRMADVRAAFGVTDDELDLDLGPLGTLR